VEKQPDEVFKDKLDIVGLVDFIWVFAGGRLFVSLTSLLWLEGEDDLVREKCFLHNAKQNTEELKNEVKAILEACIREIIPPIYDSVI
jgi:hypothetical protein